MEVYYEMMGNVQNTSRLLQYIASSEILPPDVQQCVRGTFLKQGPVSH